MKCKPAIVPSIQLLAMLLLCCATGAHAYDPERYHVSHYNNENGLPQNSIKAIAPDQYGFIWLGTESGLVRFDGRGFKLFNRNNTGISSSRIINIWRSDSGTLHAITRDQTLLGIAKGQTHGRQQQWESLYRRLHPRAAGRASLLITWDYDDSGTPFDLDSLQLNPTGAHPVLFTQNGRVCWFGEHDSVTLLSTPFRNSLSRVFTIDSSIYVLSAGNKQRAVFRISKRGIDAVPVTGDILKHNGTGKWVMGVNEASRQVFFYCDRNLYLVQRQKDGHLHTSLLLEGYDCEKERIISCYYDSTRKRLFLGSKVTGLSVFSEKPFRVSTYQGSRYNNNVFYDHIPFSDSSVLTSRGIVFYSDHQGYRMVPDMHQSSGSRHNALYRAADGTIWTGCRDTVYQLSADAERVLHRWAVKYVTTFAESPTGLLWAGTLRNGVFTIDPAQPQLPARKISTLREHITCIAHEGPDTIWIASEKHLFRYTLPEMKADTTSDLNNQVVRSIYIDRPGAIWLCTYEAGFYLYRNNRLTKFPLDRNKYLNTAHLILEDPQGFFWISTNNGLFKTSKKDLLRYATDHKQKPFYLYYSKESGFNTNEFNGGNSRVGVRLANGSFSFASVDGIVFFRPGDFSTEFPDAPLTFDRIEVDGTPVPLTHTIPLKHTFSDIRFHLATAYFGNPNNIVLEYRLDQNDWLAAESGIFAFNALSAGNHTLSVRKRAGFGNNYRYAVLHIAVEPAFWETWWFRLALLLLAVLLIWLFIRLRVYLLNRKNRMLEHTVAQRTAELSNIIRALEISEQKLGEELKLQQRLIGNIAHDIRTPLRYLTLSAKHLWDKVIRQEMPDDVEAESLYTSSEKIYTFTDNLMAYLKARLESGVAKKELDLHELAEQLKALFNMAMHQQGNTFRNNIPRGLTLKTHRQLLGIVLHNLIDNAVKNTRNGTITIRTEHEADKLHIYLSDTGRGIGNREAKRYNDYFSSPYPGKEVYTGFGFLIIKDILPLLDAGLSFTQQTGTTAVLSINLSENEA